MQWCFILYRKKIVFRFHFIAFSSVITNKSASHSFYTFNKYCLLQLLIILAFLFLFLPVICEAHACMRSKNLGTYFSLLVEDKIIIMILSQLFLFFSIYYLHINIGGVALVLLNLNAN